MKNKIILIHGKARSGKDTVAEMIRNNCKVRGLSSAINSNAHSVKEVAREVFSWDGVKDERGRRLLIDITNILTSGRLRTLVTISSLIQITSHLFQTSDMKQHTIILKIIVELQT